MSTTREQFFIQIGREPTMRGPYTLAAVVDAIRLQPPGTKIGVTDEGGVIVTPNDLADLLAEAESGS